MLLGVGISFAFASMANLIVDAVPQSEVGIATGINTVMRTVGGAFGAAVATAMLTGNTIWPATPLPTEGAYTAAFVLSAVGGVLAVVAALLVPRPRRSGRGPHPRPRPPPSAAYLMKRISLYFGSGQRSSATIFSSWSPSSRTRSIAVIWLSRA